MTIPLVSASDSRLERLGAWLFRHRTSLPLPIAIGLLAAPTPARSWPGLAAAGVACVAAGEALRLWGVHHIGTISRTRSDRLGPLVTSGPFGYVRNPLYIGNVALWVGFALCARLLWFAPVVVALLGFEYHAIVRWEEGLLTARRGDEYRAYMAAVPRWRPRLSAVADSGTSRSSWRETFFSERGTLIAIVAGLVLVSIKLNYF